MTFRWGGVKSQSLLYMTYTLGYHECGFFMVGEYRRLGSLLRWPSGKANIPEPDL